MIGVTTRALVRFRKRIFMELTTQMQAHGILYFALSLLQSSRAVNEGTGTESCSGPRFIP